MVQIRRKGPKRSEHVGMQKGANFVPTNLSTENDDPFQDPSELGLECTLTWGINLTPSCIKTLFGHDIMQNGYLQNNECDLLVYTFTFKFVLALYFAF